MCVLNTIFYRFTFHKKKQSCKVKIKCQNFEVSGYGIKGITWPYNLEVILDCFSIRDLAQCKDLYASLRENSRV